MSLQIGALKSSFAGLRISARSSPVVAARPTTLVVQGKFFGRDLEVLRSIVWDNCGLNERDCTHLIVFEANARAVYGFIFISRPHSFPEAVL